ncbi:glutathione S-transferase [Ameyamaea chiangmaiensis NBRC 103196]|nr:glutathione S-transferase [Ameyamaea chiangmaiensis NBRC 103196]
MRGWLCVHLARLDVEEILIPLAGGGGTAAIHALSPNGKVPYLEHQGAVLWESLAIGEYCAESDASLWPDGRIARAHARSIASEMHAGFRALRIAMPMILGRLDRPRATPLDADVLADIARIDALWSDTHARFGANGPFLFGATFGIADAMYAPVVSRFLSFGVRLSPAAHAYAQAVRRHPLMERWYAEAAAEPQAWHLPHYENVD